MKAAYLAPGRFLDLDTLEVGNVAPTSIVPILIKLSNLMHFLELIVTELDQESDDVSDEEEASEGYERLMEAAYGFLPYIVPGDTTIHDGILNLLISIIVQAYIASLSQSSSVKISPSMLFSKPLSAYTKLPNSLSNRNIAATFKSFSSTTLSRLNGFGKDVQVLKVAYSFAQFYEEIRNYVEIIIREFIALEPDSSSEEEEEVLPVIKVVKRVRKRLETSSEDEVS